MKKFFYIVFFLQITFFSFEAYASKELRAACLKYMDEPKITITYSSKKIKYYHQYSRKYIQKKAKLGKVDGLTDFKASFSIAFNIGKKGVKKNLYCVYPADIKLSLEMGQDIFIAKEVKKGTCRYANVVRHEQTHAQINQTIFEHYLPIMKKRFIEVVRKNAVGALNQDISFERAEKELHEKYGKIVTETIDEARKEMEKEHNKLDAAANYEYTDKLCL